MKSSNSHIALYRIFETTSLESFLFYSAFTCFSFAQITLQTNFLNVVDGLFTFCNCLLYLTIVLLILRIAILRASHSQWLAVIVITCLAGLLYYLYGTQYPLWIFLFVVSGKGIDLKKIARITLFVAIFMTAITILACCAGYLSNITMRATEIRGIRNSLGFTHPNRLAEYLSEICIAYWYLHLNDRKWGVVALCLSFTIFVYLVAGSRSSCLVFIAIALATLLNPLLSRQPKISILGCGVAVIFVIAASWLLMARYSASNEFMATLNQWLSGRLRLANAAFSYAPPTLFGNDYSNAPVVGHMLSSYNSVYHFQVDNAYVHLLLLYGVVATALFYVLIFLVYRRYYQDNIFTTALLGFTVLLILGFAENFTIDIQYNFFLFLISDVIFASKVFNARYAHVKRSGTSHGNRLTDRNDFRRDPVR